MGIVIDSGLTVWTEPDCAVRRVECQPIYPTFSSSLCVRKLKGGDTPLPNFIQCNRIDLLWYHRGTSHPQSPILSIPRHGSDTFAGRDPINGERAEVLAVNRADTINHIAEAQLIKSSLPSKATPALKYPHGGIGLTKMLRRMSPADAWTGLATSDRPSRINRATVIIILGYRFFKNKVFKLFNISSHPRLLY